MTQNALRGVDALGTGKDTGVLRESPRLSAVGQLDDFQDLLLHVRVRCILSQTLDTMSCAKMDTEHMGKFLAQVSAAHPDELMLMIVDGASSHVAKALVVPENIRLYRLPPYASELNPQEHL